MNPSNALILVGKLVGKELKTTKKGGKYCTFCLSIPRGFEPTPVDLPRLTVWESELIGLVHEAEVGDVLRVEASIRTREWQTPDGEPRTFTDLKATAIKNKGQEVKTEEEVPF